MAQQMQAQVYPAINNQYGSWAAQNPYNQYPISNTIPNPNQFHYTGTPQDLPIQQTVDSSRVWVQGESSAKAYIVKNSTEQVLWDSEQPVIYIKTVDATGKPSTVTLDYTIRKQETLTKAIDSDMDALKAEISDLKCLVGALIDQNSKNRNNFKQNYKNKGGDES